MDIASSDIANYNLKLNILNNLPDTYLSNEFLRCCGSTNWVNELLEYKPYSNIHSLLELADTAWWLQPVEEWKTAFKAHPKIGDTNALKEKFAHSSWEGEEQKGANEASTVILKELSDLNNIYFNKHGFIFLICATGKTAFEMLDSLKLRLLNDSDTELQIAAGEQAKITKLRIKKLLDSLYHSSKL